MNGMTGYGRHELSSERHQISVELRSYNSRYLELNVSVPSGLGELERRIREKIDAQIRRGRVEAHLRVADAEEAVEVELNEPLALAYRGALERLAGPSGEPITVDHLLSFGGLVRERRQRDVETVWVEAETAVDGALTQLAAARRVEGQAAAADIGVQLARLSEELDAIEQVTGEEDPVARGSDAAARARELLDSGSDDVRVVAALATLLARSDINEEMVRARGHLAAFKTAFDDDGTGKHMEFLCQEIQRELNTLAAKSAAYAAAAAAVRAKGCLERLCEQLRNVE